MTIRAERTAKRLDADYNRTVHLLAGEGLTNFLG
jgi:hypothetical protein